jgi:multisubunit Na+/H+ antiporter MnhE subunit
MLNKIALFLLLITTWCVSLYFSRMLSGIYIGIGVIVVMIITVFSFKSAVITSSSEFLFLQFGFYKYILDKINTSLVKVFKICLSFLNPKTKYISILDYVFLNKDSDSNAVLTANILTLMPGTIGILMKKRYLIVHSLDKDYFSLGDMYNISTDIEKIDDDSLV